MLSEISEANDQQLLMVKQRRNGGGAPNRASQTIAEEVESLELKSAIVTLGLSQDPYMPLAQQKQMKIRRRWRACCRATHCAR